MRRLLFCQNLGGGQLPLLSPSPAIDAHKINTNRFILCDEKHYHYNFVGNFSPEISFNFVQSDRMTNAYLFIDLTSNYYLHKRYLYTTSLSGHIMQETPNPRKNCPPTQCLLVLLILTPGPGCVRGQRSFVFKRNFYILWANFTAFVCLPSNRVQ